MGAFGGDATGFSAAVPGLLLASPKRRFPFIMASHCIFFRTPIQMLTSLLAVRWQYGLWAVAVAAPPSGRVRVRVAGGLEG